MEKHIHLFNEFNDFSRLYNTAEGDLEPLSSITVTAGTIHDYNNNSTAATSDYNGVYTYAGKEIASNGTAYLYSNGTYNIFAFYYGFGENANFDGVGINIDSDTDVELEISEEMSLHEAEVHYEKPWVSLTREAKTITLSNGKTYKFLRSQQVWTNGADAPL